MKYEEFIQNILDTRGRFNCGEEYHERHHIVPKCMGGNNDENNLIDLYVREHYEAHRLLAIENQEEISLIYAWWLMANMENEYESRYKLTAEEYEEARIRYAESRRKIKGNKHPNFGKPMSLEQKKKISLAHKGKILSEETKENIRIGHIGIAKGGKNPMAKKVICDNVIFDCISDCAKFYEKETGAMKMWLRGKNRMPQFFIKKKLRYYNEDNREYEKQLGEEKNRGANNHNSKKVKCGDKIFNCALDCAKYYQINKATMYAWLSGINNMPIKFKKLGLTYLEGGDIL